ncbi:nucleoside hydrolase [Clostridium sp. Marseille-Q2269]|uniref:nucleoside hydrolase n=1 Tax=Clostridium sp. Marseille-Q2269 TaxID=2942205 RepID=UPI0020735AEA|nr:nucleoside hydrolase [Clostridium sp. Marseille-Q2269]
MRRIIIDTDCGSDDAVAIIMALKSSDINVEAITTVAGNVPVHLATLNALMTIEVANAQKPPLYVGASKPLMRDLVTAESVHGKDGMGDCDLIHPSLQPEKEHAVDAILRIVDMYPYEIEIVTIGPTTNIALAIMKDPTTMKKVKHIYSMGTAGFRRGNVTPVAEFNVYVDAEAYSVMLNSNIPTTIIGFDVCLGEAALNKKDIELLTSSGKKEAEFISKCTRLYLNYNLNKYNEHSVELPDAAAMAVALWKDIVLEGPKCYCYVCTKEPATYGQVIIDDGSFDDATNIFIHNEPNAVVCKSLNKNIFKRRMLELLIK